jgi:hypothetical protein
MLVAYSGVLILDTLLEPSGLTELIFSVISFAIIFAVLSVVFYLAGRVVVGKTRTNFKDAFAISVLGTLVLIVCLSVFSLEAAMILSLIAWLLLVRYYYETGILGSIAVGVTSVIVAFAILVGLSIILGYSMIFSWLPLLTVACVS